MASAGCAHCFAELMSKRLKAMGQAKYASATNGRGKWSGVVEFWPDTLSVPAKKKKPTTYFVNSMSDAFHPSVKAEDLGRVWQVMADNPRHTFQILTKRAGIMRAATNVLADKYGVLPNVWLGVSVENQPCADERIEELRQTPAAVRFLSMEPLLEMVDINRWLWPDLSKKQWFWPHLSWVIVGGESGPGARPFHMEWAGKIGEDCQEAGVPVFVKQVGAKPYYDGDLVKGLGRKGNDPSLWPEALRVRQMPDRVAA